MKIGFRSECLHCGVSLHVCKNCRNYRPGKPNDCLVPGTDPISDREAMNFCEDFSLAPSTPTTDAEAARKKARKLLGLDD